MKFARYAWTVLAANVAVVLWGAVVRQTVSGDGCGQHWPKCNGQVIPPLHTTKTLIEYSHRLTSGVALILVVVLAVWAWRLRSTQPAVRGPALASIAFMISEALVGAGLVKRGLVALDASSLRAVIMSVHLTNTFFLLGALTLTASAASFGTRPSARSRAFWPMAAATAILLATGITGAIAALGDTLFPAASLAQGLAQDAAASAHVLLRLRTLHPFAAIVAAVVLWFGASQIVQRAGALTPAASSARLVWIARAFQAALVAQLMIGVTNLLLLVPLWTQLVHLLGADAVVVTFALLAAQVLTPSAPTPK